MSALIDRLKQDHREITETLERVRLLGIGTAEGQQTLLAAQNVFFAHLAGENRELYPALRRAADKNENVRKTMDLFAKDMEGIALTAKLFFTKYSQGSSGLEFAKDFGRLYATLTERIRKEENILYRLYESTVEG